MSPVDSDSAWMRRALELAERGRGHVEPNPMVGCVLVRDGQRIAEGFHRRYGGPHAEVDALGSLADPTAARGATAYVTLEPCCHTGKTPPCSRALIAAEVARVVVAIRDPFPQVAGGGLDELRAAGIHVEVGVCAPEATRLLAAYLKRVRTGRPWVIAKWAMTLDGRIATAAGDSQWISGPVSRGEVHRLRGLVDGILVGGGTVAADDPTLTARPPGPRTATRIVLADRRLPRVEGRLFQTLDQAPLLVVVPATVSSDQTESLRRAGAEVLACHTADRVEMIGELLEHLGGTLRMTHLLVEGGAGVLGSFFTADQVDEVHAYLGPKIVGGTAAPGPVGGAGWSRLADSPAWELDRVCRFDDDVRIIARRRDQAQPRD